MDYSNLKKEQIINGIKNDSLKPTNFIIKFKDDKDVMLEIVKKDSLLLFYASNRLRDDKEVVLEAIKQNGWALKYVSDRLKNDKFIVLEAVKKEGLVLFYASQRLQNDKEVLELLENSDIKDWSDESIKWFKQKMKILALLREKEFIENSITDSNKTSKKIKF